MAGGSDESEREVVLGVIGAPHGVAGAVRLRSFTERPEAIAAYEPLWLTAGDDRRRVRITALRPARAGFIATIAGIDDRDQAEAIAGARLSVPRTCLPPPDDGEFYHADLIGLAAELSDGSALGAVKAVHNFGAGDVLELTLDDTGGTILVPFTHAAVPQVDVSGGRIVIAADALAHARDQGR